MNSFWKDKTVVITGSHGFVGTHLIRKLNELDCVPIGIKSGEYDLRNMVDCRKVLECQPDYVFNLAANVGGIGYNQKHPYSLYFDNTAINLNMIQAAIENKVKKFIQLGTVCAYPKFVSVPFNEESLWDGYPEETNAPYGLAKRNSLIQLQTAREEFGFNGIYLLPTNLYGPGDHFEEARSHVIPALIKKFVEAKDEIEIWGSGNASRDFLYIDDAIEGILLAAEHYNLPTPINLGSGREVRIGVLVEYLKKIFQFKGKILYNTNKPDGQPRRCLRIWKAKQLGWQPKIGLKEGLRATTSWYLDQKI